MYSELIQTLILASSGLFSLGSITLVILLLISDHGLANGLSYALGYISAYTVIGIFVIFIGYQTTQSSSQGLNNIFPLFLILLGFLLLFISLRSWRKPIQENKSENRFISLAERFTPKKAFAFGATVTIINFKNLALFLTSLSVVVSSSLPITEKMVITLLAVFVFCLSVIIPVGIYITFPNRREKVLKRIHDNLRTHSHPISIWVPLVFGIILLFKGISDLI